VRKITRHYYDMFFQHWREHFDLVSAMPCETVEQRWDRYYAMASYNPFADNEFTGQKAFPRSDLLDWVKTPFGLSVRVREDGWVPIDRQIGEQLASCLAGKRKPRKDRPGGK
jgi:hypothetical protein